LAEAVERLGAVALDRILWRPPLGIATEEDLLRSRQAELVDGMLVRKCLGGPKSLAEVVLGTALFSFAKPRRLGGVTISSGPYRVAPGVVRLPDVAFIRWDRLLDTTGRLPDVAPVAPDLVIELPTQANTPAELTRKYREFFTAGTRLLWEVDLDARTVAVYTDPWSHTVLSAADALTGGDVLSGFTLPLSDLFDDPQLNPRK
jgi:Uma2 family endonuclease